jgi:TrmH family RNA methyltransferase
MALQWCIMRLRHIDSPRNTEIKALVRLKERRERDREKLFLIEGRREVERAFQAHVQFKALYICRDMQAPAGLTRLLEELALIGVETVELSTAAFQRLSFRQNPDGVIALAHTWQATPDDLKVPSDGLVLVVNGLEKPGNLGALLRTADATAADAVLVTGGGTDLFNPNVIRASMGSIFTRPVAAVESNALLNWLRKRGFRIIATSPSATFSFWDANYQGGTAIVLGAEDEGLPAAWQAAADQLVVVPMHGTADSLNVATTGALLLYEALRLRSAAAGS